MTMRHHATPLLLGLVFATSACVPAHTHSPATQEIRTSDLSTTTTSRSPSQRSVGGPSTHAVEDTGGEQTNR